MNPVTHYLVGWTLANAAGSASAAESDREARRERTVIALAGIIPDIDGLGIVPEFLTRNTSTPLMWFSEYHHMLHNLTFAVAVAVAAYFIAARKWTVALLAFVSFHLHLLGDLIGARGPDGAQWEIPYLSPFTDSVQLAWKGQWYLNAWPNFVITGALLALMFYWAWRRGFSPLEMVSRKADAAFTATLRHRFPIP